jgi:hypothetical protein
MFGFFTEVVAGCWADAMDAHIMAMSVARTNVALMVLLRKGFDIVIAVLPGKAHLHRDVDRFDSPAQQSPGIHALSEHGLSVP